MARGFIPSYAARVYRIKDTSTPLDHICQEVSTVKRTVLHALRIITRRRGRFQRETEQTNKANRVKVQNTYRAVNQLWVIMQESLRPPYKMLGTLHSLHAVTESSGQLESTALSGTSWWQGIRIDFLRSWQLLSFKLLALTEHKNSYCHAIRSKQSGSCTVRLLR